MFMPGFLFLWSKNEFFCYCFPKRKWKYFYTFSHFYSEKSSERAKYRVSHSKVSKVILLWWGYRFQFLLIFGILWVHWIGAFMPNSSVFIFLMLRALYGSISKNLLFLSEFWFILTFSSLFWVTKSSKPSKTFIFTLN